MIGYVMLGSNDLERARAFYDPLLAHLGMAANGYTSDSRVWYSAGPNPPMLVITKTWDGAPATVGNGSMLALAAPSRAIVDQLHAHALALGGADEGPPGLRGDDPDGFYGAYFRDLDGNKLCAFRAGPA